jgi:hypothetical protein
MVYNAYSLLQNILKHSAELKSNFLNTFVRAQAHIQTVPQSHFCLHRLDTELPKRDRTY